MRCVGLGCIWSNFLLPQLPRAHLWWLCRGVCVPGREGRGRGETSDHLCRLPSMCIALLECPVKCSQTSRLHHAAACLCWCRTTRGEFWTRDARDLLHHRIAILTANIPVAVQMHR